MLIMKALLVTGIPVALGVRALVEIYVCLL
jgi:hypothetical protein